MSKPEYSWEFQKPVTNKLRDAIMEKVCEEFECTPEQLRGPVKTQHLTDARGVYSFLCRKLLFDTLQNIGNMINRSHGSVLLQIRRIEDYISVRDGITNRIVRIENQLLKFNT